MLKDIHSPSDIRGLSTDELKGLAGEIRRELIDVVSENGGHLASNMGAVELTLALHIAFDAQIINAAANVARFLHHVVHLPSSRNFL